jgi:hypothetical protein
MKYDTTRGPPQGGLAFYTSLQPKDFSLSFLIKYWAPCSLR